jgi:hypothetical protein
MALNAPVLPKANSFATALKDIEFYPETLTAIAVSPSC